MTLSNCPVAIAESLGGFRSRDRGANSCNRFAHDSHRGRIGLVTGQRRHVKHVLPPLHPQINHRPIGVAGNDQLRAGHTEVGRDERSIDDLLPRQRRAEPRVEIPAGAARAVALGAIRVEI